MRILSQKGLTLIDVPYDLVVVQINNTRGQGDGRDIIAYPVDSIESVAYWLMARYSTKEKAEKALETLRGVYSLPLLFSKEHEIQKAKHNCCDSDGLYNAVKAEMHDKYYFQFPTEEELE